MARMAQKEKAIMTDTATQLTWLGVDSDGVIQQRIEPKRRRRPDTVFVAVVKVCGYEAQPITKSLRGAMNRATSEVKACERERDADVGLDDIADLVLDFPAWFAQYRRERFNEAKSRAPFPMEMSKLWPEYRKGGNGRSDVGRAWAAKLAERDEWTKGR